MAKLVSERKLRKRWTKSQATDAPYTYRYLKNGKAAEKHFPTAELALEQAVHDVENDNALPVHIRQGYLLVWDSDEIIDRWESKHLN